MEVIFAWMDDGNAVIPVQPLKAAGMDVRPAAALRSTEVMPAHPAKAEDPMEVIWAGMAKAPVMPVFWKALVPMLVKAVAVLRFKAPLMVFA
jgi:hypothetical protein